MIEHIGFEVSDLGHSARFYDAVFFALSDPVRVAIYARIVGSGCSHNCSNFLNVSEKAIPKSTLSQHFKALREAGLIRSERQGVEMHNTSRCSEVDRRFPGLIAAILKAHHAQSQVKPRAATGRRKSVAARSRKG